MNDNTYKFLCATGPFILCLVALLGDLVLAYFGKQLPPEIAAFLGAGGVYYYHVMSTSGSDNDKVASAPVEDTNVK